MRNSCLLLILAFVVGCSKITYLEQNLNAEDAEVVTRGGLGDGMIKAERFTPEMLATLIKNTSFKGPYTVDTGVKQRSVGTVPSMYVVNFDEGGWMIVAGHLRDNNQVLAYSETGSFNSSEITNPGVRLWYDMTKSQMESVEIVEDDHPASLSTPPWIDMSQDYYWVRLSLPETTEIVDQGYVAPLMVTKWGQGTPWNSKTPKPSSSYYCYTGCVAVSCAQILYYLQQSRQNFNIGLYEKIDGSFDFSYYDGYYYTINHASVKRTNFQSDSPKWNRMMRWRNDQDRFSEPVAELMFDIAEYSGMKFYPSASGTAAVNASIFANYGVICDESQYDFDLVRRSLDRGQPVEISCFPDDGNWGHSWVIDGYQVKESRTDRAYQWRLIPPDSLCHYSNIDYDHVYTEEQKQFYHPDLVENQVDHNYSYYRNNYLLMNWGWDGEDDDGHYSINPNWTAGGVTYSLNARIIHNFRQ